VRILPRETLEELVAYLAATYPKAFFTQPQLKRPLKKNVIVDLERDNILDDEKREAAVSFYQREWHYEWTLIVGAWNGDRIRTTRVRGASTGAEKSK
jgi:sRNA-binding protein